VDKYSRNRAQDFFPVSSSPVWDMVRSYYKRMGIEAWHSAAVPNYITTNPFIASRYAKVIQEYFTDYSHPGKKYSSKDPHYIIELGAGSGRFGYCFLKHFFSELQVSIRASRQFVYVMTDISEANIHFWKNHPQLKAFVDRGLLDFAYFDVLDGANFKLLNSGQILEPHKVKTPLAVIANYVFDSLPHDFFEIKDGQISLGLVRCKTNTDLTDIADMAGSTRLEYRNEPCGAEYYRDSDFRRILQEYQAEEMNLNLAIPVGGLTAIKKLSKLTTGPMFMLASDFGDSNMMSIQCLPKRRIATNGCYSVRVNFEAVYRFLRHTKGLFFSAEHFKSSLETVGILTNPGRKKPKFLSHAFDNHISNIGPEEFFMVKKIAERDYHKNEVNHILGLLRISSWDAKIFKGCAPVITECLGQLDPWQKKAVVEALCNVDDMYFRCDNTPDPAIRIIDILTLLGESEKAQQIINKNQKYLPEHKVILPDTTYDLMPSK
jgi:Putative S-adenosyl-L-methionine-dependent methyltransferase